MPNKSGQMHFCREGWGNRSLTRPRRIIPFGREVLRARCTYEIMGNNRRCIMLCALGHERRYRFEHPMEFLQAFLAREYELFD